MIKKALVWLAVSFAVYSILATPESAASAVRTAGQGGRAAAESVVEFFNALTPGQ